MALSQEQILGKVVQALGRCMARNPAEIRETDSLVQDLGLDSLDFLDLMFALEKSFQVKIRDADFDRLLKPVQGEERPPHLSPEEIQALSRYIPELAQKALLGPLPRNAVISMMTTGALVRMIALKLEVATP